MTVGVYYYPEHWPQEQWDRDFAKMEEMGFEFVHMGEFAWAFMEPEEGRFDFAWLDRAVELGRASSSAGDAMHANSLPARVDGRKVSSNFSRRRRRATPRAWLTRQQCACRPYLSATSASESLPNWRVATGTTRRYGAGNWTTSRRRRPTTALRLSRHFASG